jgi:ferredoxin
MLRQIISIDEDKCDGCGLCIPSCHEGALQIIDGKCRLVSDLFCDGLGACLGECPTGALKIIETEAREYDEVAVIKTMLEKPPSVLKAHLEHLMSHGADDFFNQAIVYLNSIGISVSTQSKMPKSEIKESSCPGTKMQELKQFTPLEKIQEKSESMLGHWPVQLHLVNPNSAFLKSKELIIMATCAPVAYPNIHSEYLNGKAVVLACPKLDYTDPYPKKLEEIFRIAQITKATIVRMEVPCCGGLSSIAIKSATQCNIPDFILEEHIISTDGRKISEKILFSNVKN